MPKSKSMFIVFYRFPFICNFCTENGLITAEFFGLIASPVLCLLIESGLVNLAENPPVPPDRP